jgi:hypothetical protein
VNIIQCSVLGLEPRNKMMFACHCANRSVLWNCKTNCDPGGSQTSSGIRSHLILSEGIDVGFNDWRSRGLHSVCLRCWCDGIHEATRKICIKSYKRSYVAWTAGRICSVHSFKLQREDPSRIRQDTKRPTSVVSDEAQRGRNKKLTLLYVIKVLQALDLSFTLGSFRTPQQRIVERQYLLWT